MREKRRHLLDDLSICRAFLVYLILIALSYQIRLTDFTDCRTAADIEFTQIGSTKTLLSEVSTVFICLVVRSLYASASFVSIVALVTWGSQIPALAQNTF